jgi:hypothetical protein
MGKRLTKAAVGAGMMLRALNPHPDTDINAVHDAAEVRVAVDNGVSAVAVSEDEKQLLDDVATEGHESESQPANKTNDPRQRSGDAEEAARPPGKEPEGYADEQQMSFLHARKKQEEENKEKADENVELGDREEVSGGNIIAPASPVGGESAVTGEGQAPGTAADDEERAQAAAKADQQRAEAAAKADQQRAEAAAKADQQRAEAAARADDESHQQAATQDEEQFGCAAHESEPADETWPEDDADVDDPDID